MQVKQLAALIGSAVVAAIIWLGCLHSNDIQEFQVLQSPTGQTSIVGTGGWYFKLFPKSWTYPKVQTVFFSNNDDEGELDRGIDVRFSNKGTGNISSQVVYRLFTTDERMLKLHEYVSEDIEKVENLILATLKDIIMEKVSGITSSQAVEDRELLANSIRTDFIRNPSLMSIGIDVEQFSITQITYDDITTKLFTAQQEADLQKNTAEAEKQNLIMQKERTEAEYEQEIAVSKGKADVEKMKMVTDAERTKELAEINAQMKVSIETLAKEEALVKASKVLELAEIDKKMEVVKLEIIKTQAEQTIESAKAKEQEIKLSGAITESERIRLEMKMNTTIGVAEAVSNGLSKMTLPKTVIIGGSSNGSSGGLPSELSTLLNLRMIELTDAISK